MRWVLPVAFALALCASAFAALALFPGGGPTVTVGNLTIEGTGSCGLGVMTIQSPTFSLPPYGQEHFESANVPANPGCVIDSITSSTQGFAIVGANTPYVVGAESAPFSWVVQAPLAYHGDLVLVIHGHISDSPAVTPGGSSVPNGLYLFSWGQQFPSAWIALEAVSFGATLGLAMAWFGRHN